MATRKVDVTTWQRRLLFLSLLLLFFTIPHTLSLSYVGGMIVVGTLLCFSALLSLRQRNVRND